MHITSYSGEFWHILRADVRSRSFFRALQTFALWLDLGNHLVSLPKYSSPQSSHSKEWGSSLVIVCGTQRLKVSWRKSYAGTMLIYIWSFICVVQCLQVLLTGTLSIKLLFLDEGRTLSLWETICLWGYRQADFKLRGMQPPKQTTWPWPSLCGSVQGISHQITPVSMSYVKLWMARACCMVLWVSMLTTVHGPWLCLTVVQARHHVSHPSLEPPEHSSAFSGLGVPECNLAVPGNSLWLLCRAW